MEANTKENGKMINKMALARRSGIMEQRHMKDILLMERNMEKVNFHGVMALTMKEIL